MSTKPGSLPVSELQTPMGEQSTSRLAFPRFPTDYGIWLTGLRNTRKDLLGHISAPKIHETSKGQQDWPQRRQMDLRLVYVRYGQAQLYPATWHPPASWSHAVSHETHQYADQWKEPCSKLPHRFQSQTGWCVFRRIRQVLTFHHPTYFVNSNLCIVSKCVAFNIASGKTSGLLCIRINKILSKSKLWFVISPKTKPYRFY